MTNLNLKDHVQNFGVAETIHHPDYKATSHYHDIGLIKLDKNIALNPFARPACLYLKPEITARKAIATGFGRTQFSGLSSEDLLKVTLELFDQPTCNHSYRNQISRRLNNGIVGETQICAGSFQEEKDTCQVNTVIMVVAFRKTEKLPLLRQESVTLLLHQKKAYLRQN